MQESIEKKGRENFLESLFIILTSLTGAFFSGYLFYSHFNKVSSGSVLFKMCQASGLFDCQAVNTSKYSAIFGFPLAGLGLFFYLFILAFIFLYLKDKDFSFKKNLLTVVTFISFLAVLVIIPLFYSSFFLIKTFCLFCIITWICNLIIFILLLLMLRGKGIQGKEVFSFVFSFYKKPKLISFLVYTFLVLGGLFFASNYLEVQKKEVLAKKMDQKEKELLTAFQKAQPEEVNIKGIPIYAGDPNAKVTIVEYMNFNCGACRRSFSVMHSILEKHPHDFKLYLKNFPLDGRCNPLVKAKKSGLSCLASLLTISVREDKKFKPFVDSLISIKGALNFDLIKKSIDEAVLEKEILLASLKDQKISKILEEEVKEGIRLKVDGTPTFIINGKVLPSGLPPLSVLEKVLMLELENVKRNSSQL